MKHILAVAFAILLLSCQTSPEDVVTKFYHSLESGEISAAKECLSQETINKLGETKTSVGLEQLSGKITKCGGIKDIKISLEGKELEGKEEVREGTVIVTYLGECPSKEERIALIKEDGKWKISLGNK